ncbi:MAG: hypothetical protein ABSB54_14140 [Acidimicrobiales bacterium]|jgi:hypothetical protein
MTASSETAVSDHTLRSLSHGERADLLRRLQMLTASEFDLSRRTQTARRWFIRFLAVCCVALIPWTIGLGLSLPRTYVAANWRVLWTGFDVVLLGSLSVTAWGLWKQRQVFVPAAIITSVLLLCDAWFDLFTANGHRDVIVSAASALFAEVPLAAMLSLLSVRALRIGARAARALEQNAPVTSLWRTPLITFPDRTQFR